MPTELRVRLQRLSEATDSFQRTMKRNAATWNAAHEKCIAAVTAFRSLQAFPLAPLAVDLDWLFPSDPH